MASHKFRQYLLPALKVLVLVLTFGYIFLKVKNNEAINFPEFIGSIFDKKMAIWALLFCSVLATANWFFEIWKWKTVVAVTEKIDIKIAAKQCLASLTVSLATPNRIGEYGAKALFFESSKRKKVLLLNFFSNVTQMLVTTFFGILGLFYFIPQFKIPLSSESVFIIGLSLIIAFGIGYFLKEKELLIKGFTIGKSFRFFNNISATIKLKTLAFSLFRYCIFSGMFCGLLLFFGAEIKLTEAFPLIFTMYLLVSILPTLFIFDVVVRSGIAVWVFSFIGVPELTVLSTVLVIWLFNFVLPSLLGSFFVITYQPTTQ